jgi:hypothetical protein
MIEGSKYLDDEDTLMQHDMEDHHEAVKAE